MNFYPPIPSVFALTDHALCRMQRRGISRAGVEACLRLGRRVRARGAILFALGRRQIERARREGLRLEGHEGLHVVCSNDGAVLTVFKNRARLMVWDHRRWRR